jgi:excisionase family DNA binding protein
VVFRRNLCHEVRRKPILAAGQVAELLQLNIDYVRKLSRERTIPAHRLPGGRTFRYFKDEVLDWLRGLPLGEDER